MLSPSSSTHRRKHGYSNIYAAPLAIKPEDYRSVGFKVILLVDVAQRVQEVVRVFVHNLDQQSGAELVRRFQLLLNQQRFFLVRFSALRFEIQ